MAYIIVNGQAINQKSATKATKMYLEQVKEVVPSAEEQVVTPDFAHELTSVVVKPVQTRQLTVKSTNVEQSISAVDDVFFDQVTVEPIALQEKDLVPTVEDSIIEPDEGYIGFSKINLKGLNDSMLDLKLNNLTFKPDEDYIEILPRTTIYEEEINTYESIDLSTVTVDKCGASYGFVYSSNGYLVPQNKGRNNSYAYGKIIFDVAEECDIKLGWYQSSETCCDYGVVSQIDQTLSLSTSVDSGNKWQGNGKSGSGTITFTKVPAGEHFITFKYRKDGSVNSGSDEFRITSMTGTFGTIIRNEIHLEATALTRVQINKPETLIPENIIDGVTIMGVRGSHACDANWVDRTVEDMDLSSGTFEIGPKFDILGDKTLRYSEIDLSTFQYESPTTYKFMYSAIKGGLVNDNQKKDGTFAYAKLIFDILEDNTVVRIHYNQNSEQFYDFGIISKWDESLSLSNAIDKSYQWSGKGLNDGTGYFDMPAISSGKHFITIKYRKDSSHTSLLGDDFIITKIETIEGNFGYNYVDTLPINGDALKKVFINKPDTLIPENIKKGVNIFGIVGSDEGIYPEGELHVRRNGTYDVHTKSTVKVEVEPLDEYYDFNIMRSVADMYRVLGNVGATWTDEEITETLNEYGIYRNKVLGLGE